MKVISTSWRPPESPSTAPPPPLKDRIIRASVALGKWLAAGAPTVDETTHLARAVECSLCPRFDAHAQRCLECGCYAIKLRLATERCPLRRW